MYYEVTTKIETEEKNKKKVIKEKTLVKAENVVEAEAKAQHYYKNVWNTGEFEIVEVKKSKIIDVIN